MLCFLKATAWHAATMSCKLGCTARIQAAYMFPAAPAPAQSHYCLCCGCTATQPAHVSLYHPAGKSIRYVLPKVSPGRYMLTASRAGWCWQAAQGVEVAVETSDVEAALLQQAGFQLQVRCGSTWFLCFVELPACLISTSLLTLANRRQPATCNHPQCSGAPFLLCVY